MKATILDTVTGQTGVLEGMRPFCFAEGNWSCDCNRNLFGVEEPRPEGCCQGAFRFLVIDFEWESAEEQASGYTLADFNDDYPADLVKKHIG